MDKCNGGVNGQSHRHHVEYYDYTVSHHKDDFENSVYELLKLLFPTWGEESITLTQFKDGITNKLVKCQHIITEERVLVRVYGIKSELLIDREAELDNFTMLQSRGLSPPLYARFLNGFVYGFVEGLALDLDGMGDEKISSLVARKVAEWHKIPLIQGHGESKLFPLLWRWLDMVPKVYKNSLVQSKFKDHIDIAWIKSELTVLECKLKALNAPVVFCHNDLLSGNIIYNEQDQSISFIDFEYGCANYRGFDIGNHFCEFAGFLCEYNRYPSKSAQLLWLTEYWLAYYDKDPSDEELEAFHVEVNSFALVAHFYWGIWSLVQASFSDIDFDYISYAVLRFNRYKECRDTWLS